jgi:hypothetical protein
MFVNFMKVLDLFVNISGLPRDELGQEKGILKVQRRFKIFRLDAQDGSYVEVIDSIGNFVVLCAI